jgi:hypothetical protein
MTYGSSPRSTSRNRCMATASSSPNTAPARNPAAVMPRVNAHACNTTIHTGRPPVSSGSLSRVTTSQRCGMDRSSARGSTRVPNSTVPSGLPTTL